MRSVSEIFLFVLIGLLQAAGVMHNNAHCVQKYGIRQHTREVTKLRVDHIRALVAQRKGVGQSALANQDTSSSVQTQIDKLKECLSSIR